MNVIGENIKMLRYEAGMSQEDLARRLKKSRSAVSQYESGDIIPRMGVIEDMASIFNVSKSRILGESMAFDSLTQDERELLALFRRMDDSDKPTFINMARTLAFAGDQKKEDARRAASGDREAVTDERGGHHA